MKTLMYIRDMQIDQSVDLLDCTPSSEPDPDWFFIDSHGHKHKYGKNFSTPTLRSVVYGYYEEGEPEYRHICKKCEELIEPGTRSVNERRFMQGLRHTTVTVTFCITSEKEVLQLKKLLGERGEVEILRKEIN